ncbi:TPA: hypothetical protein PXQ99_004235 [Yersinia enterocolitica]|nr:hypothetical protein [Yersinia enterocolitica]
MMLNTSPNHGDGSADCGVSVTTRVSLVVSVAEDNARCQVDQRLNIFGISTEHHSFY